MPTFPPVLRRRNRLILWVIAGLAAASWLAACKGGTPAKAGTEILFFTTNASFDEAQKRWDVPIHGWIFKHRKESVWEHAASRDLMEKLEASHEVKKNKIFESRLRMFLTHSKDGEHVQVVVGGTVHKIGPSDEHGHFTGVAHLEADGESPPGVRLLDVEHGSEQRGWKPALGTVQLIPPEGVSVVSDIDDTIKISQVLDGRELLKNTFLRPFPAVPGMADAYTEWAGSGVAFHYVSASPWQLYPALSEFVGEKGFPGGSLHLRIFSLRKEDRIDFFGPSEEYKIETISGLLGSYPSRRFILVGDSGEKDPEVYGNIARSFPGQVLHIFIREIEGAANDEARFNAAWEGVPDAVGRTIFTDPAQLEQFQIPTSGDG